MGAVVRSVPPVVLRRIQTVAPALEKIARQFVSVAAEIVVKQRLVWDRVRIPSPKEGSHTM
jgi:hypothetical protein